jgi:DNA polymerase-1
MASSYFDNFVQMADSNDLLHPSIETVQARTGRMSVRQPALQTLPRVSSDPDSKLVRSGVLARTDEEVLVACDYEQIELRQTGSFSGDDGLCQAFEDADAGGDDFFTQATRAVYSDDSVVKSDDRRATVKSLFYASAYGAGVRKMALTAGVSVDEMQAVHSRVFSRYPGLPRLMKHMERLCKENDGWIVTPSGRRVYVNPDKAYAATNGLVQASAADTMKKAIVRLAKAGLEDMMVVPVHDEMLVSVPRDMVDDVKHVLQQEMTDHDYRVTLSAHPSDGYDSWGAIPK